MVIAILRLSIQCSAVRILPVTISQDEDATEKLSKLRLSLLTTLNDLCRCTLTDQYISNEELSCRGDLDTQIVYRGRVKGNEQYSSGDLVSLMQSWVNSGKASFLVGFSRLEVDPLCPVSMDSNDAPDCFPPPPTSEPKTDSEGRKDDNEDIRGGEVGGIMIGVLIAILLVVLIVLVAVFILRKLKPTMPKRDTTQVTFSR